LQQAVMQKKSMTQSADTSEAPSTSALYLP
jgi:hypothetical protein